ncbi:MAG: hypothetical protein AAF658_13740, partial [Myxococcota bacterium]
LALANSQGICHNGNMPDSHCTCGFYFGSFERLPLVGVTSVPAGRNPETEPAYDLVLRRCPKCGTTLGAEKRGVEPQASR